MIPDFLADLHLDQVLAAYTANVDLYIHTSTNKQERIVDSEALKVCGFVRPGFGQKEFLDEKHFTVNNPTSRDFALLQIDHAAINTNLTKKCDCSVISSTDLLLIEFKANATSTSKAVIKSNYKKAMNQLRITKDIFQNGLSALGRDIFTLRNIEAFVCFRKGYPRLTASELNYRVSFAVATGGVPIYFDSYKEIR